MSDVITVRRAADALGVTPQALYLAIREGRVASKVVLDRVVIPRSEFNRLKRERTIPNGKDNSAAA